MSENDTDHGKLLELTANIVAAHVSNNHVPGPELPATIEAVYGQLAGLGVPVEQAPEELKPAVPIKKSVTDDHIICLEDGKQLKMLKRHLSTAFNMTPDEYRTRWGLPYDYPMVAPGYARKRAELAKKIGLGRKKPAPKGRRKRA